MAKKAEKPTTEKKTAAPRAAAKDQKARAALKALLPLIRAQSWPVDVRDLTAMIEDL